ncbi:SgcJ/EcaC family oxidoreductase [Streptomyces boncukensis]|uniref:SgcJ/EcaC family oxidoreductase n=1 Tax=Streptomyces boncukensis TaxID=2711219 RepID=A0A6G4X358_9ACTN|nr:SgcJ/EcaC family oxidoreductase [Streptomyces boncukensis]NGO71101.1 SgcJ/EcaC family oxidoreductase [Streptomyces boncukensis]
MAPNDQDTVEAYLDRLRSAWDAADAKAYGEQFAEDASYVIFMGDALFGRAEITSTHRDVFEKWQKGTRMAVKAIEVRDIDSDSVAVVTVGGIGKGKAIPYDKLQTFILRSREGRFECVAFQNTEMSRRTKKLHNES